MMCTLQVDDPFQVETDRVAIRVKAMSWARVDAIIVHYVVLNMYVGSL